MKSEIQDTPYNRSLDYRDEMVVGPLGVFPAYGENRPVVPAGGRYKIFPEIAPGAFCYGPNPNDRKFGFIKFAIVYWYNTSRNIDLEIRKEGSILYYDSSYFTAGVSCMVYVPIFAPARSVEIYLVNMSGAGAQVPCTWWIHGLKERDTQWEGQLFNPLDTGKSLIDACREKP